MRFRNQTIFVTGGAGFIGSAVIRHLLDDTERACRQHRQAYLRGQSRLDPAGAGQSALRLRTRWTSATAPALRALFDHYQPDAVMNLAAESHVDRSIDGPARIHPDQRRRHIHAAAGSTALLARARCRPAGGVPASACLHRRSLRLARLPTGLFTETTAYAPNSPYSASKASSDHLVRAWHETYGLPTLVTNCSNNYGPYQFPEKLIPHMIIKGLAEEPLPVYGDGLNVRDWLYVEDHARALTLVLERGRSGETYNIGGRNERTNKEVVTAICDLLDHLRPRRMARRDLITLVADRPGHDRRYAIDPTKIERELGWRADETSRPDWKTVRWFLDNRDWWVAFSTGATR